MRAAIGAAQLARQIGELRCARRRQAPAQSRPVKIDKSEVAGPGSHRRLERLQDVGGFECLSAHPPDQRPQDSFVTRKVSRVCDGAPADARCGKAETAAFVGQRLDRHIGGDVRGLTRVAEQRRRGGIQHEKIQRL